MADKLEDKYIIKNNKKLRFGYTTGSCAAAAAKAAAQMLLLGETPREVKIITPSGIMLNLEVRDPVSEKDVSASCAIKKDAGDDPDATDGLMVYARVRKCAHEHALMLAEKFSGEEEEEAQQTKEYPLEEEEAGQTKEYPLEEEQEAQQTKEYPPEEEQKARQPFDKNGDVSRPGCKDKCAVIGITGGEGVGVVTLPGLTQKVGAPAINAVPREMIIREVTEICEKAGYTGALEVTISVPGGEAAAEHTFNPRLGIKGGISILGTSGIVEPMSEAAIVDTIKLEMRQKTAPDKKYIIAAPGNYGMDYLDKNFPFGPDKAVKCSNYIGQTIDMAVNMELSGLLFVAHIGKFVKVAGGIMNTHSSEADARMEILAAAGIAAGADASAAALILDAVTTDEGISVLKGCGREIFEGAMRILAGKTQQYLEKRAQRRLLCGAIVFSNKHGELYRTKNADELVRCIGAERQPIR